MLDGGPTVPDYLVEMAVFDMLSLHVFLCRHFTASLISFDISILGDMVQEIPTNVFIEIKGKSTLTSTDKRYTVHKSM